MAYSVPVSSIPGLTRTSYSLSAAGYTPFIPIVAPLAKVLQPVFLGGGYLPPGIYAILSAGANLTYSIEATPDDILVAGYNASTANVVLASGATGVLTNATISQVASLGVLAMGLRAHVTSYTSGSLLFAVVQGSY